jgi:nicotinamide-nucleotide amidase
VAVTPGSVVVTVGAAAPAADEPGRAAAAALVVAGLPATARVLVEDDEAALERALGGEAPLTLVLAGPGGSSGDIVRRVLARVAGVRLVLNDRMLAALDEAARRRERPLGRRAERQALLPIGATPLPMADGDPAWMLEVGARAFVVAPLDAAVEPLVPQLAALVQPRLAGRAGHALRTLRVIAPLAEVEDRLADWLGPASTDVEVSTLPADGEVWVRLRARGATPAAAMEALAAMDSKVMPQLGDDCYGRDDESLERVVGGLLLQRGLMLAVAESCTGGLVGHRLTAIAGSSAYFERGVMVYSNRAKEEMLGVPPEVLRVHGAVSAPCAEAMARGICAVSGAACGIAVTGIAGPGGGTPTKPVGTVFVGIAVHGEVETRRFRFAGDRASVKWQSSQMALDMLRRRLLALPPRAGR